MRLATSEDLHDRLALAVAWDLNRSILPQASRDCVCSSRCAPSPGRGELGSRPPGWLAHLFLGGLTRGRPSRPGGLHVQLRRARKSSCFQSQVSPSSSPWHAIWRLRRSSCRIHVRSSETVYDKLFNTFVHSGERPHEIRVCVPDWRRGSSASASGNDQLGRPRLRRSDGMVRLTAHRSV